MSTLLRAGSHSPAEAPALPPQDSFRVMSRFDPEESLVADRRGDLTPGQMVELKLRLLLRGKGLPISHIQMVRCIRART